MSKSVDGLVQVIAGVRRCFRLLASVSDEMIADLGLTASMRAVLEHLNDSGPLTVPQIARDKALTRQSIQALVDQLRDLGFVTVRDNPAHRRSVLVTLTPEGKAVFRKVQSREARELGAFAEAFDARDLATTAEVLASLHAALESRVQEGRGGA